MDNYTAIIDTLATYKAYAEEQGLQVFAIALKGSQNYNLVDSESDIDANLVFIPTLAQLRSGIKFKFEFETGDVVCHSIYKFAEILSKGNPQWVEVCNSEYVVGDLSMFAHYNVNPSALKGMMMEKVHAFDKLYPSREKYVKQFGYDPKQLHHIIRLYDIIVEDIKVKKYIGEERDLMMQIKRGTLLTKEEAFIMRDKYIAKLSEIYETRKIAYREQVVDYDTIDTIVKKYICKHL